MKAQTKAGPEQISYPEKKVFQDARDDLPLGEAEDLAQEDLVKVREGKSVAQDTGVPTQMESSTPPV